MIDNKGRVFKRISVVDIIILLCIAIAVGGFVYKMRAGNNVIVAKANTPIKATFLISEIRNYTADSIKAGDLLYEEHGGLLGKILYVKVLPAKKVVDSPEGKQVYAEMSSRFDAYVTVEAEGAVRDGSIYIAGNRIINKGSDINVETNKIISKSTVYDVSTEIK